LEEVPVPIKVEENGGKGLQNSPPSFGNRGGAKRSGVRPAKKIHNPRLSKRIEHRNHVVAGKDWDLTQTKKKRREKRGKKKIPINCPGKHDGWGGEFRVKVRWNIGAKRRSKNERGGDRVKRQTPGGGWCPPPGEDKRVSLPRRSKSHTNDERTS